MPLPLPSVVANTGPGGNLVTSLGGMNALNNAQQQTKYNALRAQYAPISIPAEAMSKLAYANLVGPQYVAKIMQDPRLLANMTPEQQKQALAIVTNAGLNHGSNNALMNMPQQPQQNSQLSNMVNNIKKTFGFDSPTSQNQQPNNALLQNQPNLSSQDRNAIGKLQPGEAYTVKGNEGNNAYSYDQNGNNVVASPEEVRALANGAENNDDFFSKAGKEKGKEEQYTKSGAIRAATVEDLDKQYEQALNAEKPIKRLIEITQNPVFKEMRNTIPFFQEKQLSYLEKVGTPEQQKIIGDLRTNLGKFVSETVNSFKGKALEKEFGLADRMKPSENDTWDVMVGKLESIAAYNEIVKQRSRFASQLVQDKQMNRGSALEAADQMIDGDAIRKSFEDKLTPSVSEEDIMHTAKIHNISPDEVKKRLKAEGRM